MLYEKNTKKLILCVFTVVLISMKVYAQTGETTIKTEEDGQVIGSERLKFINEAYKYLDVPYKYAGSDKGGFDCSGLVCKAAADSLNIGLPRSAFGLFQFAKRVEENSALPGDLLFFDTVGKISHVGIYLGDGRFIHSASAGEKTGVIISSLEEKYWKKAYRFTGRIIHFEKADDTASEESAEN